MSPCSDVSYKIADQWFVETKMDASSDLTEERVNVIVTGDDVSEEDDRGEASLDVLINLNHVAQIVEDVVTDEMDPVHSRVQRRVTMKYSLEDVEEIVAEMMSV